MINAITYFLRATRLRNKALYYVGIVILFATLFHPFALSADISKSLNDSINRNLNQLDLILKSRNSSVPNVSEELVKANLEFREARTYEEQYNALRSLFNYYRTNKLDSALIIAEKRLGVAKALKDSSKINSAQLNIADIYTKIGRTDYAISILDDYNKEHLAPHQLKYYNNIYKTALKNKVSSSLLPKERIEALEKLKIFRKNEILETDKNSRAYLLIEIEELRDAGMYKEALKVVDQLLKNFDITSNAPLLYEIGLTYLEAGKTNLAIQFLSKAALIDISNHTKEYQSLILLADVLFEKGDINRAFKYINYALEDAIASNAVINANQIIKLIPNINQAFSQKEKEIKRRTAWFLGAIGVLNIVLVILIILLFKAHRVNKLMLDNINELNRSLKVRNKNLVESDQLKMENLKHFMLAYSSYISQERKFRKNILRLLSTSQYNKAKELIKRKGETAPDSNFFQEMFDTAFISMFPDFISRINEVLKPEYKLTVTDKLTPELRIAALMKLGITSTNEIAEMFQYSPQSVYNLRSSLKTMLTEPFDSLQHLL